MEGSLGKARSIQPDDREDKAPLSEEAEDRSPPHDLLLGTYVNCREHAGSMHAILGLLYSSFFLRNHLFRPSSQPPTPPKRMTALIIFTERGKKGIKQVKLVVIVVVGFHRLSHEFLHHSVVYEKLALCFKSIQGSKMAQNPTNPLLGRS